jgi:hypothetical protein
VIAVLNTLLSPDLVVMCGGVARPLVPLLDDVARRLPALTYAPPRLACSTLGDWVVTHGAITVALDHVQTHALDRAPGRRAVG